MASFRPLAGALLLSVALGLPELGAGCISPVSLDNRPCPCASGYTCCATTQTCMTATQICPAQPSPSGGSGSGSAGVAGSGSTNSSGGTTSTGGDGGGSGGDAADGGEPTAGAGGDPGPPRWRAVGADLDEPQPSNLLNLEIAPDGTPYLGFRGCNPCMAGGTSQLFVRRFDGAWQLLPSTGLPTGTKMSPALHFDAASKPYLLIEDGLHSFDGQAWLPASDVPPLEPTADAFISADGQTLYTTLIDNTTGELRVVRLEGSGWQTVGAPVLSNSGGARVHWRGGNAFLAHAYQESEVVRSVFVRVLNGDEWQVYDEFEGSAIEIGLAADDTMYIAIEDITQRSARLLRRNSAGHTELGTVPAWGSPPRFAIASDGTVYIAYLVEDFVNVNFLEGLGWRDLESRDLGNASLPPALLVSDHAGGPVPYVALLGSSVRVRKYE